MKRIKGMTFIEVLIAIVIVGMSLYTMLAGLNFASKYARHNANKIMALCFAQELMEKIYLDLEDYDEYEDTVPLYQNEGVNIQADRDVEIEEGDDVYKKVTVTVSWDWQGRSYNEQVATLRYNY